MATDFFERQAVARRTTRWLVVAFFAAMLAIVGFVTIATALLLNVSGTAQRWQQIASGVPTNWMELWGVPLALGVFTMLLICGGTLFKVVELRGGGTTVAESLGGRRVTQNTTDPVERRLVNIVEEMALASGVPVPPIYLLQDEQGINAFAAGYSPSDAVVAVTRGTAEQLTREELQGVVAHEFSHILNGDMRLNIRLIGILHGLLLLGLVGRMLFRIAGHGNHGRRSSKSGNAMIYFLLFGLALIIIGSLGTLIGGIIKAAVSRQREYLADASAVQFTRNPSGIAGALKRIGAAVLGSRVQHPNAAEVSHMYFGQGVWEGFTGVMATHPPLTKRIRRLEPHWDGKFPKSMATPVVFAEVAATSGLIAETTSGITDVPIGVVRHAAEQVACPAAIHRTYAAQLLKALDPAILEHAHEPYGARAVMFAMLLDRDQPIRDRQLEILSANVATDVIQLTLAIVPRVDAMDVRARLPLVDLTLPALRTMTARQYHEFQQAFHRLVQADQRIELFEWVLHCVLVRHLRPQFEPIKSPRVQYFNLKRLGRECGVLLSTLARMDHSRQDLAQAHQAAAGLLPEVSIPLLDAKECKLGDVQSALATLSTVAPKHRQRLVEAAAVVICYDHEVTIREAELFRGICDMLDCPMPPLLPGQKDVVAS